MENSKDNVFQSVGQWFLMGLAFLFPLWVVPSTIAPIEFNKEVLVAVVVFLAFIFYLTYSIKKGSLSVLYHWSSALLGVLMFTWLLSAIFAGYPQAIWGGTLATTSFFDTLTFILLTLLIMHLFDDAKSIMRLFTAIIGGLSLYFLSVLLFSVFGLGASMDSFFGGLFQTRSFNTMGSWNTVAFVAGFFIVMIYPFLLKTAGKLFWVALSSFILAIFLLIYVNFIVPVIILGCFALLLLSYSIWKKNLSSRNLAIPMALLLVSVMSFFLNDFLASSFSFPAPLEVSVNPSATLKIASQALRENIIFGAGPASFGYLWDQFKPLEINNTIFWGIRFMTGSSFLLSLAAEIGFLGWALFISFLGIVWFWGIKALTRALGEGELMLSLSSFLILSYSLIVWIFYSAGYALFFLGFLALGMELAILRMSGILKLREFALYTEGPRGFISALFAVFLILAGVGGLYVAVSRYAGQVAYANGVVAFNRSNNIDAAENALVLALKSDKSNDLYLRTLADLYSVRASLLLRDNITPTELLGSQFKEVLDKAISHALNATKASPQDFQNYRSLGKIYELLVGLNASGALDAAEAQYDTAIKLAPRNPLLWRDKATAYLSEFSLNRSKESLELAEKALIKSVELKPDYAEGHFLLAQVHDAKGEVSEAIIRGEAAALLAPNDIGTLFQLGLLYYRSNRYSDAEIVFKRAVEINNIYSNARYFLGLIYDKTNRKQDAINEFEKIASFNPDNEEVKVILANLKAGNGALNSVPPPAPERRQEPPVQENR
jgi:tetratricopeptide (TPR) repeat protein